MNFKCIVIKEAGCKSTYTIRFCLNDTQRRGKSNSWWEFPGSPAVRCCITNAGAHVQSLVRELRSHMTFDLTKKKKVILGNRKWFSSVQSLSCVRLCDPMNCSMPGLPVHDQLPESTQTHVHWVGDAIQPPHPLLSLSPPALNLSQHQGLFKLVSSPHQVAKVLEFQLQHQSFQWTPRTNLL